MATEEAVKKVYQLPKDGIYSAQVSKVFVERDKEVFFDGKATIKNTATLVYELLGEEGQDDEGKPIQVRQYVDFTKNLSFKPQDGPHRTTKAGKVLQSFFGKLPEYLGSDSIDWEGLAGCFSKIFVVIKENKAGVKRSYVETQMDLSDAAQKEFNADRRQLVIKESKAA